MEDRNKSEDTSVEINQMKDTSESEKQSGYTTEDQTSDMTTKISQQTITNLSNPIDSEDLTSDLATNISQQTITNPIDSEDQTSDLATNISQQTITNPIDSEDQTSDLATNISQQTITNPIDSEDQTSDLATNISQQTITNPIDSEDLTSDLATNISQQTITNPIDSEDLTSDLATNISQQTITNPIDSEDLTSDLATNISQQTITNPIDSEDLTSDLATNISQQTITNPIDSEDLTSDLATNISQQTITNPIDSEDQTSDLATNISQQTITNPIDSEDQTSDLATNISQQTITNPIDSEDLTSDLATNISQQTITNPIDSEDLTSDLATNISQQTITNPIDSKDLTSDLATNISQQTITNPIDSEDEHLYLVKCWNGETHVDASVKQSRVKVFLNKDDESESDIFMEIENRQQRTRESFNATSNGTQSNDNQQESTQESYNAASNGTQSNDNEVCQKTETYKRYQMDHMDIKTDKSPDELNFIYPPTESSMLEVSPIMQRPPSHITIAKWTKTKSLEVIPLDLDSISEEVDVTSRHNSQTTLDIMTIWDEKLLTAASEGNIKEVELCVKNRANLECRDSWGMTPLLYAAERGNLEVVTYLVTHGSQLEATSPDGKTALHYAARNGYNNVTKLLTDKGCSPWVKTKQGDTPYDLVKIESYDKEETKRKKEEVMDFLKTAMSKTSPEVTPDTHSQEPAAPVFEDSIGKGQQSAMLNRLYGKGSYESFDMRCMVTGQFSVGKSTLVKLLAGEIIPDGRHPTDGISLVEGRCGLDVQTKEWILVDPDSFNALDVVYSKVLMSSLEEEEESELTKKFIEASNTSPTGYAKATLSSLTSEQSAAAQSLPSTKSSNVPHTVKQMEKKMRTRMTKEEIRKKMEKFLKSGKYKMKVGRLIFWDFGGQYVYLTTHQTFMTFRALFLVVFDGSKDLHEQVPDVMCFPGQHMTPTPAVFLQYWVNSILTYCKVVYAGIPKILFVATHKDKVPMENIETRRAELYRGIEELFKDHVGKHHLVLRPLIFVNAKDQADREIGVLKKTITELTFDHPCWGERMPNACVPLELEIAELVAEGKQIMSLAEVKELNAISEVSVLSPEQLTDFLHFHHSLGKIVYFDTPQLRDNVMINPLLMVEVMRSFITDVAFWPKEDKTRKTFKKMSENGMIQKVDLYQIWEQEEFRQILPFKEYIFDMLIHLDIVSEQRRYDTKTGSRLPIENFFVPCMLTQRNNTDYLTQECTPERTLSLSFVFKGTIIPPALPNRLICACLSMWTLKEYQGRKLMFSGFVGLSFDKEHDIVVCVEGNKILLYLVHKRSKGLIIPDIATSVRDCLFVTLERISEFYQSSIHCKASNKLPFLTEYSCSKLNCFTSENKLVSETEECLCKHGENIKNNWRTWNKKKEQKQCDAKCQGLSKDALSQIPSNTELLRLSNHCEAHMLHELALHLGMEDMVWSDMVENYPTNTQMVKFLTLIHLKENYEISFAELDNGLREMEVTTHKLCVVRRRKQVKSGIPDDILDCFPSDEILDRLAPLIGNIVFQLGIELGLSVEEIESVKVKRDRDLLAQNKEVLFTWRKDRTVKPTIRVLEQAFVNIGKGSKGLKEVVKDVDPNTLKAVETATDRIRENENRIKQDVQISQILDHMMTHLVISADDRRDIEHYPRQDDQNKALLDIVIKRREHAYSVFVDGLRNYGYEDIANDLKCDTQETIPSTTLVSAENEGLSAWNFPSYKVRLQKNYLKVIIDIQHENIVDHLITREVLSVDDGKKIESGKTPQEKNRNLMDMLLRKNEQGFNEFLKALKKDSIYADLADQIEKTLVTSTDMATLYKCSK